jgi:BASS family bile acid:Na+ symporter
MVAVPATGFLLARVYPIDAAISLGIVILALCPGGAFSNILTRLAGGDVALSVSLTASTTLLSIATLPAVSVLAAQYFVGDTVRQIEITEVLLRIALISTLPVLLGTGLRHFAPRLVERHEPIVFRVSFLVFMFIVAWSVFSGIEVLKDGIVLLGGQLATLALLLLGLGYGLGKLFRLSETQSITLSIETGLQNGALGLVIGSMLWADSSTFSVYATPSGVYGLLNYIFIIPVVMLATRAWRAA